MIKLDQEEKKLLESYDEDEWKQVSDLKSESEQYRGYAKATFRKDKRVNICMSQKDLMAVQKKALEEGTPYQTLLSSIEHYPKYVTGRLTDKNT